MSATNLMASIPRCHGGYPNRAEHEVVVAVSTSCGPHGKIEIQLTADSGEWIRLPAELLRLVVDAIHLDEEVLR